MKKRISRYRRGENRMDIFLKNLIDKKIKLGKLSLTFLELVFLLVITLFAVMLRSSVFSVASGDYTSYFEPWIFQFKAWDSLLAISEDVSITNIPILYILYLISKVQGGSFMLLLKVILSVFDFILAFLAGYLAYGFTKSKSKTILTYAVILVLPTVVASSAMWSQFEVISAVCVLLSFCFALKDKPYPAILFYTIATLFLSLTFMLLPLYLLLWMKGKVQIQHLFLLPVIAVISFIPALLNGRSFKECTLLYLSGSFTDKTILTRNWPNIFEIIGKDALVAELSKVSILLLIAMLACIFYYLSRKKFELTPVLMLRFALFFSLLMPFFLPYMQERSGYMADILAVIYAVADKKKFYIPLTHVFISYTAYSAYFSGETYVSMRVLAYILLALVVLVGKDIFLSVNKEK